MSSERYPCLVMNGLADVDRFKICIQVCMWLGFPPLIMSISAKSMTFQRIGLIYSDTKWRGRQA